MTTEERIREAVKSGWWQQFIRRGGIDERRPCQGCEQEIAEAIKKHGTLKRMNETDQATSCSCFWFPDSEDAVY